MLDSSLCFLENDKKTAQSAHSRHGLKMRPCGGIGRRAALKMQYLRMCPFESGQGHHLKLRSSMVEDSQTAEAKSDKPVYLQPENQSKKYDALFVEIDKGDIKLPMFQREFVWEKEQTAKLIDSIIKGFPIGTFIFWKTKEELRSYKEIGNHRLPETPKGDYAQYILDGQQRITSLYAIRKGIRITKDGKEIDYQDIYINLDFDPKTDEQISVVEKVEGKNYIVTSPLTSEARRRSDIAHELGHIILQHELSEIREVDGVPFRSCRPDQEEQATAFGATVLLPRPVLLAMIRKGFNTPEKIAIAQNVSVDMARFRLNTTGVLKQAQRSL